MSLTHLLLLLLLLLLLFLLFLLLLLLLLLLSNPIGGDGPSLALLTYMAEYDFESPSDWNNYRSLTSK